jgi:BON domain-containing protein/SPW repeat-containing protein
MAVDRTVYLPSGILVLAGLWLIASPWVLGEVPISQPSVLNAVVTGILVALLSAGNIWGATRSTLLSWLIAALGVWTSAAPFVFGYASNSPWTWSSVITGVIVFALGAIDATTRPLAAVPPQLADVVHGPWVAGRYYPGFAFEYEDHPLWPLLRRRESSGSQRGGWEGEFRGVGPRGWRRPDEQIMNEICGRMADHPRLDAGEIEVTVTDGEITLQGIVSGRAARRLAEDIADSVSGVRDVTNQLRVRDRHGEIRRAA